MKRLFLVSILVLSLLVLSLGTLTLAQEDGPEAINIGATIPLTGAFAGGGAQVERGYMWAVEDINAAGGVFVEEFDRQIPLNLIIRDDESDPNLTVSNLEDFFSNDEVVAYLGGFGSSLHAAAAAIAEKNGVPYLGVAFALWDVHQQGFEFLFSPFPKSPDIAVTTFEFLNATLEEAERPLRVGILQETTDWGIELGELWVQEAEAAGYEVVVQESYTPLTQDFTDLILQLQNEEVQLLLTLPNPPDGLTLFTQMAELGYAPEASLVVRATDVPTWPQSLGVNGDWAMSAPGWHPAIEAEGVEAINERHIEEIGRPADAQVGPSYALVQILAAAIEEAGTLDRQAVRDAIAAIDIDTVIGNVTFNEDGTGNVITPLLQYQAGTLELVWPAEFATADFSFPAPPLDERESSEE